MTTFNKTILATIISFSANSTARDSLVATLRKAGVRSTDMYSPSNPESTIQQEDFNKLNTAIVAGMKKEAQQMIAMDADNPKLKKTDTTSENNLLFTTANRRYHQQQIGSVRNSIKKALGRTEAKAAGIPQRARPAKVRIVEALREADKVVEQLLQHDDYKGNDVGVLRTIKAKLSELSIYAAEKLVSDGEANDIPVIETAQAVS